MAMENYIVDVKMGYSKAVLGISLRKVSYEALVFSVFSRNQE